jgi:hypothetical protein
MQNDEQFKTFAEELEKHYCELDNKVGRCYFCFVAESFLFMIRGHEYYIFFSSALSCCSQLYLLFTDAFI